MKKKSHYLFLKFWNYYLRKKIICNINCIHKINSDEKYLLLLFLFFLQYINYVFCVGTKPKLITTAQVTTHFL